SAPIALRLVMVRHVLRHERADQVCRPKPPTCIRRLHTRDEEGAGRKASLRRPNQPRAGSGLNSHPDTMAYFCGRCPSLPPRLPPTGRRGATTKWDELGSPEPIKPRKA